MDPDSVLPEPAHLAHPAALSPGYLQKVTFFLTLLSLKEKEKERKKERKEGRKEGRKERKKERKKERN
jgi:hypothetical protein